MSDHKKYPNIDYKYIPVTKKSTCENPNIKVAKVTACNEQLVNPESCLTSICPQNVLKWVK